ncbi:NUDIX domain-containing protein [Streptomyces mobaraensis]|uniref:NUDIX hydrolase n=1 Tax=Streptomyces mobaraensis TaxID=35621 RepID=A0A5N5W2P3_STRMB|nr:NUDIX hydrolase [Streptomyces mobaraensis]KAB7835545.1 NUDIX hydrolase [Streptomyces mobaraensis]
MRRADHYLVGAGVYIQRADGRVLLVHHAKTGAWVIPGGKAEAGESPRQCARREAHEETGLSGRVGRLLAVQHLSPDRWWGTKYIPDAYELFVFALDVAPADYERVRVPEQELHGWGWFAPEAGLALMDATNRVLFAAAVQAAQSGTCCYVEDCER